MLSSTPTTRAHGSLEDALNNGATISEVRPHENDAAKCSVFALLPSGVASVYTNVSRAHVDQLMQAAGPQSYGPEIHKPTRAHGSLEQALNSGGTITEIHAHENSSTFSVTVHVPGTPTDEAHDMIYTAVSLEHLSQLGQVYPDVAEMVAKSPKPAIMHASKFDELLEEPGSKISSWHPNAKGTYVAQVSCEDGCHRVFPSVSEEHMKLHIPGFAAGSSQVA
ncbi:hypothetical protein HDU98_000404 [Podochytrium sp. JEL0797]|nr:hypothetical protein HDU98_000404 [Podochytrium sp. JEL0797]